MSSIVKSGSTPPLARCGFEDALVECMDRLWRVAMQLCKYNEEEAKDLLQESCLRAYRGRDALAQAENPFAWLRRVVVNTFLNYVRDNKQWKSLVELDDAHWVVADTYESTPSLVIDTIRRDVLNDELLRALNTLPELTRTLFILSDIEEFTHEELAKMFGMPKGTVSARIYRGRKQLARSLEHYAVTQGYLDRSAVDEERHAAQLAMEHCPDRARQEEELLRRSIGDEEVRS